MEVSTYDGCRFDANHRQIEKSLYIQVVRRNNQIEKGLVVDLNEILVPNLLSHNSSHFHNTSIQHYFIQQSQLLCEIWLTVR